MWTATVWADDNGRYFWEGGPKPVLGSTGPFDTAEEAAESAKEKGYVVQFDESVNKSQA